MMKTQLIVSLKMLGIMTLLLGIIYPFMILGTAQVCFNKKANGSIIEKDDKIIGSILIGQQFNSSEYFSSRPSATEYKTLPSGASNLSLTSKQLRDLVSERIEKFITENKLSSSQAVPSEMLFASGSGLDPHISAEAALLQVDRIAEIRKFSDAQKDELKKLIEKNTENPTFGILGEARINVLKLNLQLDQIK